MTAELPRHPALADEAPCDRCRMFRTCAAERLACQAFGLYVLGKRWASASRFPTARRFARIYATDAEDEEAIKRMRAKHQQTMSARGTHPGRKTQHAEVACQHS